MASLNVEVISVVFGADRRLIAFKPAAKHRAGPDASEAIGEGIVHVHRPAPAHEEVDPAVGRIGRIQNKHRRRYLILGRQDLEDGAEPGRLLLLILVSLPDCAQ
ncbi:hypothetical protein [Mesorhizobium sp.]|uniref:hypothetical protein n=1 Tax=Mesorhizobium sp. TaxID=1871066 RepID=UPI000FE5CC96|nr:MAG: hypothetical protein EOQ32_06445 [Mesorhizobium sp.]RWE17981.1 MAG: hypothetical protein EOS61_01075 [Mesorhizobium sp.]